jgi:hypothetical protein
MDRIQKAIHHVMYLSAPPRYKILVLVPFRVEILKGLRKHIKVSTRRLGHQGE